MSLTATNQFNGSEGALIDVPYSDINLGVTNGFLDISNLLAAEIPLWSGSSGSLEYALLISVSTTNFVGTNANGFTVTNDNRVLLVNSQLIPFTQPQVQNLKLHSTNNLHW